jgi:hypothetical protein
MAGVGEVEGLALHTSELSNLRGRKHAVLRAFPLGGRRRADLVLERFEPFAPGARAEVVGPNGTRTLALPDQVYFNGKVDGEDDSRVLLIARRNRVHGFVVSQGDVYPFGPAPEGGHRSYAMRDTDPTVYRPPGDFCGNDLYPEVVNAAAALAPQAEVAAAAAPGTLKLADVAIETDKELRAKFATDQAALEYLAALAAGATTIYERDVAVRLRFSYIRLWSGSDPWRATSPSAALTEVKNYWNDAANNMAAIAGPRTVVHFLSGKGVQGGVAYINVLCDASFGYGVSQVFGSFDLSNPQQIWDVLVFAHELGHNFGSPHTHCYSPPIDKCYNQESGCYSGAVVVSRGTVMSYCHLVGGLGSIDLVFGSTVSARIGQTVAAATCLQTVTAGPTTTTTTVTTTTQPSTVPSTSTPTSTRPTNTTRPRAATTSSTTTSTTTTLPRDTDGDGVLDGLDRCAATPAGEMVDATGCSVCPCAGPVGVAWRSRSAYLGCVRAETKRRLGLGMLDARGDRDARAQALKSSCGRANVTRCCLYRGVQDASGHCRVVKAVSCRARHGVDVGAGSCMPSPCAR